MATHNWPSTGPLHMGTGPVKAGLWQTVTALNWHAAGWLMAFDVVAGWLLLLLAVVAGWLLSWLAVWHHNNK